MGGGAASGQELGARGVSFDEDVARDALLLILRSLPKL
jgi:hypothetical protein